MGGNQKQPENEATSDTQNTETISLCLTDTDASSTVDPRADTRLETVGGAEKEGAAISPKKEGKKDFSAVKPTFSCSVRTARLSGKTGDFYFTFSLACVPPQGTLLLAHKEAAQFLAAGRSRFPAALTLTLSMETTFKD